MTVIGLGKLLYDSMKKRYIYNPQKAEMIESISRTSRNHQTRFFFHQNHEIDKLFNERKNNEGKIVNLSL